jgi:hypothetical protein
MVVWKETSTFELVKEDEEMEEVVRELSKNEDDLADILFGLRFTALNQGCCILYRGSDHLLPPTRFIFLAESLQNRLGQDFLETSTPRSLCSMTSCSSP